MQSLKSLFVTLLILGGAFLAYDRYLAPDKDKLVFKPAPAEKKEASAPAPAPALASAPTQPVPSPAPAVPEVTMPKEGESSTAMASTPPPAPPMPAQVTDAFIPPHLPTIEDATGNWLQIPASAFPRQVNLLRDATFKAGFGSTLVKAGASVTALAAQQGMLTLAPNTTSALRASMPIDSTDLKAVLTLAYDAWSKRRIADARRAWEQRDAKPVAAAAPAPAASLDATGRPQRGTDGAYPLLLASMKSGMVTEITPQSIKRWGEPEKGDIDGKPGWIVTVEFDAVTAFGKFSTEAIAKVVNGRVMGWYYKGSGEVVP